MRQTNNWIELGKVVRLRRRTSPKEAREGLAGRSVETDQRLFVLPLLFYANEKDPCRIRIQTEERFLAPGDDGLLRNSLRILPPFRQSPYELVPFDGIVPVEFVENGLFLLLALHP